MGVIYLLEGPVGAGKSTYAGNLSLQKNIPRLTLDEWMVTLFQPDRPQSGFMNWYAERKTRCLAQIWLMATELLDLGSDVILELGLVQQADRQAFYALVDITDHRLRVIVLDTPEEVRRERIQRRNDEQGSTYQMDVSPEIFALANSAWQPPDETECQQRHIEFVSS